MDLQISSPCPMSWNDLAGDGRIRYCGRCRLNVYNLAEMSPEEVEGLVRRTEGRLCGRLYLRGDRTASVRDCPARAKRTLRWSAAAAALFLGLGVFGWIFRGMRGPDLGEFPLWIRHVVQAIDPPPAPPQRFLMGKVIPSRQTPADPGAAIEH